MSDAARNLMFWIGNANAQVADNERDSAYCLDCARKWAAAIIAGNE